MMESHKQNTIIYALGFVESFIDDNTQALVVDESRMSDEEMVKNSNENEYREQVNAMWKVLDQGVKQVMAENLRLQRRIDMAEMALKG